MTWSNSFLVRKHTCRIPHRIESTLSACEHIRSWKCFVLEFEDGIPLIVMQTKEIRYTLHRLNWHHGVLSYRIDWVRQFNVLQNPHPAEYDHGDLFFSLGNCLVVKNAVILSESIIISLEDYTSCQQLFNYPV